MQGTPKIECSFYVNTLVVQTAVFLISGPPGSNIVALHLTIFFTLFVVTVAGRRALGRGLCGGNCVGGGGRVVVADCGASPFRTLQHEE